MIARSTLLIGLVSAIAIAPISSAPVATADDSIVDVKARDVRIIDGCRDLNKNGKVDPYENWRIPVEDRVNDLLPRMTYEEKIGQMSYPSVGVKKGDDPTFVVEDGGITVTAESEAKKGAGFMMPPFFGDTRRCAEGVNQIQEGLRPRRRYRRRHSGPGAGPRNPNAVRKTKTWQSTATE